MQNKQKSRLELLRNASSVSIFNPQDNTATQSGSRFPATYLLVTVLLLSFNFSKKNNKLFFGLTVMHLRQWVLRSAYFYDELPWWCNTTMSLVVLAYQWWNIHSSGKGLCKRRSKKGQGNKEKQIMIKQQSVNSVKRKNDSYCLFAYKKFTAKFPRNLQIKYFQRQISLLKRE